MSRFLISNTSDWELVNAAQDMRGFAALDGTGAAVGRVVALVADTDAEVVSAVVLDTGAEIPAVNLTIGDGVVYLAGAVPGAATATAPDDYVHPGIAPRTVVVSAQPDAQHAHFRTHHAAQTAGPDYAALDAAYRYGYAAAHAEAHRNRAYDAAEADLRAAYPTDRDFIADREAVRYGYRLAQHGLAGA